jgi:hypothetical protein
MHWGRGGSETDFNKQTFMCSVHWGGYVTEKSSLVGNSKFLFDIQSLIYCINKIVRKSETKAIKSLEEISSLLT